MPEHQGMGPLMPIQLKRRAIRWLSFPGIVEDKEVFGGTS